ncbi:anaphase-promoting complex subunit cdc27 [Malassezia equina]|uniref:Anaphase-promoting complex subunit cdc27 n=1 Tax=Malassezia equina TaxID=1381935 RepID=A0AAF0J0J0_9BASI|nr:anaphase-promoting complex subunit cdc27 [Malassezia equina]
MRNASSSTRGTAGLHARTRTASRAPSTQRTAPRTQPTAAAPHAADAPETVPARRDVPEETEDHVVSMLVALAESYLHVVDDAQSSSAALSLTPDMASATLYASLAVAMDASCVAARRLLAMCYLMGGAALLFPFAPSSLADTRASGYEAREPSRACALSAIHVLQQGSHATFLDPGSARVYASACRVLGRFQEAYDALQYTMEHGTKRKALDTILPPARAVYASQVYTQMGRMAMKQAQYAEAAAHFQRARDKDPFNWSAWTALCDMGMAPPADASFVLPGAPRTDATSEASGAKRVRPEPGAPTAEPRVVRRTTPRAAALRSGMARDGATTTAPRALATSRTNVVSHENGAKSEVRRGKGAAPATTAPGAGRPLRAPAPASASVPGPADGCMARARTPGTRATIARAGAPEADVLALVQELGEAYRHVRLYEGAAAVEQLCTNVKEGPARRAFRTAGVYCLLGRALHDMTEYADAEAYFSRARALEPSLLMHMDIYSLVLFQLHREVALSALAQDLLALDPRSAVAHLAAGNTWSLQHQHDAAYQCFQQATLVAPECAYAYTLAGYEALELDQPQRAVRLFRSARRCDRRHWNALAGLGQVYLRQGQPARASEAYAQAFLINRSNAVLLDLLGWALEQTGDTNGALAVYQRAISMQPKAAMTRWKKAQLLLRTVHASEQGDAHAPSLSAREKAQRRQAAHAELLRVCALAPAEPRVHLMLARSYMRLGGGRFAPSHESSQGIAATPPSEAHSAVQLPHAFHVEIAQHLAAAVDLDPRYARNVSAMGDLPKMALHGMSGAIAEDEHELEHELAMTDEEAPEGYAWSTY